MVVMRRIVNDQWNIKYPSYLSAAAKVRAARPPAPGAWPRSMVLVLSTLCTPDSPAWSDWHGRLTAGPSVGLVRSYRAACRETQAVSGSSSGSRGK